MEPYIIDFDGDEKFLEPAIIAQSVAVAIENAIEYDQNFSIQIRINGSDNGIFEFEKKGVNVLFLNRKYKISEAASKVAEILSDNSNSIIN